MSNNNKQSDQNDMDPFDVGGIHDLWHRFTDFLHDNGYGRNRNDNGEGIDFGNDIDWKKVEGYETMELIQEFIEQEENQSIEHVRCDDNVHASSDIFLIPHENDDRYFGTSMVYVPQCTQVKNALFLYPNHVERLLEKLRKIQERTVEKNVRNYDQIEIYQKHMWDDVYVWVATDGNIRASGSTRAEAINKLFTEKNG